MKPGFPRGRGCRGAAGAAPGLGLVLQEAVAVCGLPGAWGAFPKGSSGAAPLGTGRRVKQGVFGEAARLFPLPSPGQPALAPPTPPARTGTDPPTPHPPRSLGPRGRERGGVGDTEGELRIGSLQQSGLCILLW